MDSLSRLTDISASKESLTPEDAPISALFERLLMRLEDALEGNTWVSSHINVAILLNQLLLDLQHWNQDIQNHKCNTLEQIGKKGGELAMTIRICLLRIASDFEQLQRSFATVNRDQM
jgi:hypothetical protein